MAIDVYLSIDGIKGESSDDRHKDWIECRSVSFGVEQPKSATASTGGGHTAERCEHRDIVISKLADLSSPILLQTCPPAAPSPRPSSNSCVPTAGRAREILRNRTRECADRRGLAGRGGGRHPERKKSRSNSPRSSGSTPSRRSGGGAGGNTSGGWDLSANRIV
jgi:type VI secretion system secreted protein Hcp